jgi:hypothetical protein
VTANCGVQSGRGAVLQRRCLKLLSGLHKSATEIPRRSLQAGGGCVPELHVPGANLRPGQGARAAPAEPHRASSWRPRRRQRTPEGSGHQQPGQVMISAGGREDHVTLCTSNWLYVARSCSTSRCTSTHWEAVCFWKRGTLVCVESGRLPDIGEESVVSEVGKCQLCRVWPPIFRHLIGES